MGDAIEEYKRGYFSHPPPLDGPRLLLLPSWKYDGRCLPPGIWRKELREQAPLSSSNVAKEMGKRNCVLILRGRFTVMCIAGSAPLSLADCCE